MLGSLVDGHKLNLKMIIFMQHSTCPKIMDMLSGISTTLNLMNSKLTMVFDSLNSLSNRQYRLEASLEELTAALKPLSGTNQ